MLIEKLFFVSTIEEILYRRKHQFVLQWVTFNGEQLSIANTWFPLKIFQSVRFQNKNRVARSICLDQFFELNEENAQKLKGEFFSFSEDLVLLTLMTFFSWNNTQNFQTYISTFLPIQLFNLKIDEAKKMYIQTVR